jgi:ABC-type tungstate transport system permease subunit
MAATIQEANEYIASFFIDNSDWLKANEEKKQRILNVSNRTLSDKYADLIIPDEAVYEFSAVLAVIFNDTNRMNQQGVAGFSVTGVGSFTFKETAAKASLEDAITPEVKKLIGKANDIELGSRVIKDVTM